MKNLWARAFVLPPSLVGVLIIALCISIGLVGCGGDSDGVWSPFLSSDSYRSEGA